MEAAGWAAERNSPVSEMNLACVYMTISSRLLGQFCSFRIPQSNCALFLPYLAALRNNFHAGDRAYPVVSVYMKNSHPGKRDLASFKRDLGNRASPLVPYTTICKLPLTVHSKQRFKKL